MPYIQQIFLSPSYVLNIVWGVVYKNRTVFPRVQALKNLVGMQMWELVTVMQ